MARLGGGARHPFINRAVNILANGEEETEGMRTDELNRGLLR